jgi:hypothetical protein
MVSSVASGEKTPAPFDARGEVFHGDNETARKATSRAVTSHANVQATTLPKLR